MRPSISRLRRLSMLAALALLTAVFVAVPFAMAAPGNGTYMRYVPGLTNITGRIYLYQGWSYTGTSMTAGSGRGSDWDNPCIPFWGRIPNGWYSTQGPTHHRNDFAGSAIRGRVWYLTDKALPRPVCDPPVTRDGLFVHTEETASGGQICDGNPATDDPWCWDNSNDYSSQGCVKVSHATYGFPDSIGVLDSWWTSVGGQHQTPYSYILCVGTCSPP